MGVQHHSIFRRDALTITTLAERLSAPLVEGWDALAIDPCAFPHRIDAETWVAVDEDYSGAVAIAWASRVDSRIVVRTHVIAADGFDVEAHEHRDGRQDANDVLYDAIATIGRNSRLVDVAGDPCTHWRLLERLASEGVNTTALCSVNVCNAIDEFYAAGINRGAFAHDGDEILARQARNVDVTFTACGVKFRKRQPDKPIFAVYATAVAFSRAWRGCGE
jgi:hypothetical protein